jgi:Antirestriction protein (ArdA)
MYEGEPDEDYEELLPIFSARTSDRSDGGLRGTWMDAAEYIAGVEERIALWFRRPIYRRSPVRDGDDHSELGFLYLGDSESLAFIAEMAAGIIKHGQAFTFWVREMGNSPDALEEFEKVFLGHWKSAEEFAQHVLDDRGYAEESEHRDGKESPEDLEMDAKTWAQDLQRRGEINVMPNPQGGVWVFRGW